MVAAPHVLDGDGAELRRELADRRGRLALLRHEQVAEVEGEGQAGDVERREVVHRLDEHPGLGFQGGAQAQFGAALGDARAALAHPAQRRRAVHAGPRHAGPEGDGLGAQHRADLRGAQQERDAPPAPLRARGHQRRLVLLARIEQVARAGLDHAAQAEIAQEVGKSGRAPLPPRFHRVEVVVVERQRDAVVARVGDQPHRVVQAVVGRAVGVVGEAERHAAALRRSAASCAAKGEGSR